MSADISGANPQDYTFAWLSGERSFTGPNVHVALEHDTEFTLIVRDSRPSCASIDPARHDPRTRPRASPFMAAS